MTGVEVGKSIIALRIEIVLQGISTLGTERVEVLRLGPGVGGVDLQAMG
jgi:hypothetical protein